MFDNSYCQHVLSQSQKRCFKEFAHFGKKYWTYSSKSLLNLFIRLKIFILLNIFIPPILKGYTRRNAGLQKLLQPCSRAARKWRENEEMKRKWRENEEIERKWRESEEMEREWGNGVRNRMRERMNFISVFPSLCCKTLKFLTFSHKTLKYVTFCRKMLKYGTFFRECRKNRNIRAMRKWFWIKSGCEEAPQVVPAWCQYIWSNIGNMDIYQYR